MQQRMLQSFTIWHESLQAKAHLRSHNLPARAQACLPAENSPPTCSPARPTTSLHSCPLPQHFLTIAKHWAVEAASAQPAASIHCSRSTLEIPLLTSSMLPLDRVRNTSCNWQRAPAFRLTADCAIAKALGLSSDRGRGSASRAGWREGKGLLSGQASRSWSRRATTEKNSESSPSYRSPAHCKCAGH